MCGIFGLVKYQDSKISDADLLKSINSLFIFSQTRGSEAAGIAINNGQSINIYKKACSPREFIKTDKYKKLFKNSIKKHNYKNDGNLNENNLSIIGHSRLVTNGYQSEDHNNQPVAIQVW